MASSSSPRRQLTGEVRRLVAAQRGRAALGWPAPARLFITKKKGAFESAAVSLKTSAFLPTGQLRGIRLPRRPNIKLSCTTGTPQDKDLSFRRSKLIYANCGYMGTKCMYLSITLLKMV